MSLGVCQYGVWYVVARVTNWLLSTMPLFTNSQLQTLGTCKCTPVHLWMHTYISSIRIHGLLTKHTNKFKVMVWTHLYKQARPCNILQRRMIWEQRKKSGNLYPRSLVNMRQNEAFEEGKKSAWYGVSSGREMSTSNIVLMVLTDWLSGAWL